MREVSSAEALRATAQRADRGNHSTRGDYTCRGGEDNSDEQNRHAARNRGIQLGERLVPGLFDEHRPARRCDPGISGKHRGAAEVTTVLDESLRGRCRGAGRHHLRQLRQVIHLQHDAQFAMRDQAAAGIDDVGITAAADLGPGDHRLHELQIYVGQHDRAVARRARHRNRQVRLALRDELHAAEVRVPRPCVDICRLAGEVDAAVDAVRLDARDAQPFAPVRVDQRCRGDRRLEAQQSQQVEPSPLQLVAVDLNRVQRHPRQVSQNAVDEA